VRQSGVTAAAAFELLEPVDAGDVRVTERGEELRFALEARDALTVGDEGFRNDFQRNVASEFGITGAIDLAHSACAQRRLDLVGPDACPRLKGHDCADSI